MDGLCTSAHAELGAACSWSGRHGEPSCDEGGASSATRRGNAIDAAHCGSCLGRYGTVQCGLGGGGFALVHHQGSGTTRAIDFRERALASSEP